MAFCPKCGKRGITTKFCSDCSEEELNVSFKDIKIKKCVECEKYFVLNKWKKYENPNDAVIKIAMLKINNPDKVPVKINPHFEVMYNKPGLEQEMELEVTIDGVNYMIPGIMLHTYCPICSKKDSQYLEGVLQLRNATPELIKFVKDDLEKHKDTVFVVKESATKNIVKERADAVDYVLTSSKYLRYIGRKLANEFNGELTETAKLFSFNHLTSKDIYRINVLFKLRNFTIGDIITDARGRRIKVKTLGKRPSGIDQDTGKKIFVEE